MEVRLSERTGASGGGGKTAAMTEYGGGAKQSAVAVGSEEHDVTTYAANRLNQYSNITYQSNSLQPNSLSSTYDLNGNMAWDGTNTYFWDLQNQLVLVSNAEYQEAE